MWRAGSRAAKWRMLTTVHNFTCGSRGHRTPSVRAPFGPVAKPSYFLDSSQLGKTVCQGFPGIAVGCFWVPVSF